MRFLRRTATNPCSPLTVHLGPTAVLDEFLSPVGLDSSRVKSHHWDPRRMQQLQKFYGGQFKTWTHVFLIQCPQLLCLIHPDVQCRVDQIQTAGWFQHVCFLPNWLWSHMFLSHDLQDGGQTPRQHPLWVRRSSCLICYPPSIRSICKFLFICINPIRVPCFVHNFRTEAPLIVDVGANVGLFALWARERWTKCQLWLGSRFLAPLGNLFPNMALKSPGPKSGDIPSRIKTPQLSRPQPTFPHLNCRICIEPLPPNLEKLQENLEEAEMVSVLPCGCHHITLFRWFQFGVSQP